MLALEKREPSPRIARHSVSGGNREDSTPSQRHGIEKRNKYAGPEILAGHPGYRALRQFRSACGLRHLPFLATTATPRPPPKRSVGRGRAASPGNSPPF